jgi:arylsulfatase
MPLVSMHWTLVDNIKRDPFEQATGLSPKSAFAIGGSLAAPSTAYMYDWNMLPIGQQLWLKWLESLREFPPLQAPASYNLDEIEKQVRASGAGHASE